MAFSESLADRVRFVVGSRPRIEEKKMFGGLGFLLNGNMLVGVWKQMLIVRLGPDAAATSLRMPHVREFDITGRAMTGWIMVEPDGLEHDDELNRWVQQAMTFVKALPAK